MVRRDTGEPVVLRGVNRSGLEYVRNPITDQELDAIARWGANLLRLPFNQSWALSREGYDAEPYLALLDAAVAGAAERGMYTLLDLQWLNEREARGTLADGRQNFVPPLPDRASIELWRQLARRYRNHHGVLFDLLNEPHDALADDPVLREGIDERGEFRRLRGRRVGMRDWQPWARHLLRTIRGEHPEALIVVSGVDWGYDLRGFPLVGERDVVYSAHVYPAKGTGWERAFGHLVSEAPVLVGELGGEEEDIEWGERLLAYLRERRVGWAAWSWRDHPHLIEAGSTNYKPTKFGELIRDALTAG